MSAPVIHPSPAIAPSTKRRYEFALQAITKGIGKFIADVTIDDTVKYVLEGVKNKKGEDASLNTKRLYLSALAYNAKDDAERQRYKEEIAKIRPSADEEVENQSLSAELSAKYMDWKDVMKCQEKAKEMYEAGTMNLNDYLLICLYTLQAPVRADYSEMRVVKSLNSTKNDTNYAELTENYVWFEFRHYKTAKTYGIVGLPANPTVAELIRKKKSTCFAKVCYVSSLARDKLTQRLSELFVKCGGKPITINLLRHSYITQFYKDYPNPSIELKKQLAKKMLHSRFVQEVYNLQPSQPIPPPTDEGSDDGVPEETAHPYMPFVTNFTEPTFVSYSTDHVGPTLVDYVGPREAELEQKNIELSLRIVKMEEDLKIHHRCYRETLDEKIQLHRQVGKLENDIKLLRQIVEVEGDITEAKTTLEIAKQNTKLAQEEMLYQLEELTKDLAKKHSVSVSVGLGASV